VFVGKKEGRKRMSDHVASIFFEGAETKSQFCWVITSSL
jgi:hypothetical protein